MIKHKGTHFACKEIMDSFGGKAWCCKCVGHSCLNPAPEKECVCSDINPCAYHATKPKTKSFVKGVLAEFDKEFEPLNHYFAWKKLKTFIKSALSKHRKELISQVCQEIAGYSPLSAKDTKALLKIIREL